MPYRRIASDVKKDILSSLKSGKTVPEMAKLHAVSEQTIYGLLSKNPDESVSRLEYNKLRRKYEEALQIIGEPTQETKKELAARLGVSVSSLYYKPKRPAIDEEVKLQIEAVMAQNPTYGQKRIAKALKLNKKRILRVMHTYDLKPYRRRKKRLYKKADRNLPPVKHTNVSQLLCPITPDIVWVSDFTYIKYQGKFIYLATILDDFTRELVGFNTGRFHNKELVLGALEHALSSNRKPQYLHSDQGSEYQSRAYEKLARAAGIQISMSAKSSPWENAKQESFYSHFKVWLGDTKLQHQKAAFVT